MPSTPEAAAAALACAKLGAVHSIVFGGFAPSQLATRIALSRPRVVVTTRYAVEGGRTIAYKPLVDEAVALLDGGARPAHVLVVDREGEGDFGEAKLGEVPCPMTPGRDLLWRDMRPGVEPLARPVEADAMDVLYLLYTSGTTATPKGIERRGGGHAVALKHSMSGIMGCEPGDVYWAAADFGTSPSLPPARTHALVHSLTRSFAHSLVKVGWSGTRTASTRRCSTAARA